MSWCVVAHKNLGFDVYGPFELRGEAATKAVVLEEFGYQQAYAVELKTYPFSIWGERSMPPP